MQFVTLPNSNIKVPRLILGTWQFGDPTGTYQKQTEDDEFAIVQKALDVGINCFDTAEAYAAGESERSLGKALKRTGKKREEYIILDKVSEGNLTPEKVVEACNRSLTNLGTDYIDVYQIHWANHSIEIKDTLNALKKLKDEGKIKAIGVSNFGPLDLEDAYAVGVPIVSNQLPYSLIARSIEFEIAPSCVKKNIGILGYSSLGQGLLTGRYKDASECSAGLARTRHFNSDRSAKSRHGRKGCEEELFKSIADIRGISERLGASMSSVALAWILAQPFVTSAIIGASRPGHLDDNIAGLNLKLDDATIKELNTVTEPVKQFLGPDPDLWATTTRYR